MEKMLNGVLTKTGQGFMLYNQKCELNLSDELKHFWQKAVPIHLRIELDDYKVLLNQRDDEIYYDKDSKGKYKLHINGICIDDVLERAIFKQIYVIIKTGKDNYYGRTNSKS